MKRPNQTIRTSRSRPPRALAAGLAAILILVLFAGRAAAGSGDYPSPLYLAGGPSSLVGTSFQLVGGTPAATPATPTAAAAGAGSLSGTYTYVYTVDSGAGVFTASATSNSVTLSSGSALVGNLPTGVTVDVYRQKSATGLFYRVDHLLANASTTYTDNVSDAAAAASQALPQADNRIATLFSGTCGATTCGYLDFSPGVAPATASATMPPTLAASPSLTPNNKGWIVDGPGGVTIPAGSWTFQVRTKNTNSNGVAHLVVGVWKVTTSGGTVGSSTAILAPNCTAAGTPAGCPASAENGTNIVTSGAGAQTIAHSVSLPAISLAAGEHLYVQFWRRQVNPYSSGGGSNRLATMVAYDGLGQISHPAASTFPNDPVLQTPADAARTNSTAFTATFSDPDAGDTGTVSFQVCSDASCSTVVANGPSTSTPNGSPASWTPALLPDGSYFWRAQATDAAGGVSNWTATRSFTLDRTAPSLPALQSPATGVLVKAPPALGASLSDADAGDTGALTFQVCNDAACSTVVASGTASGSANGATLSWTPTGLADRTYYWRAQAADAAGNQSGWAATRTFTLDSTAPRTILLERPGDRMKSGSATFRFTSDDAAATFECSLDGAAFTVCTSPKSYDGLADGRHGVVIRAVDAAGNVEVAPRNNEWNVDTVPPETTISAAPADPSNSVDAAFTFSASEDGATFECKLDGGSFVACASPQSYGGLADGTHTFSVRATDAAGNTDPTSAARSWSVDTRPPATTITVGPDELTNKTAARFGFSANEADSSFQCSLDGGAFAGCTTPQTYSGLADGTHRFEVRATDAAGNGDPTPAVSSWTVDTVAPATPGEFAGVVRNGRVTLRWTAPADESPLRAFLLYVNGVRSRVVDGDSDEVRLGKFDPDDGRAFAVAAIDRAGNEGPATEALVGVPNLVGLKFSEAAAALAARKLGVEPGANASRQHASAIVVAQKPATPAFASTRSAVELVAKQATATSLHIDATVVDVSGVRDRCSPNGRVSLKLELSATAAVTVRFLTASGGPIASDALGSIRAGTTTVKLPLPPAVKRPGTYRVVVTATRKPEQVARADVRLALGRSHVPSFVRLVGC